MTGLFESLKNVSDMLTALKEATFATCDENDKDIVSHERVNCEKFPLIAICLHMSTRHYLGTNTLTPPQLTFWPPKWKKESTRIVLIGNIIAKKDTQCNKEEFAVIFEVKDLCIFKEKKLLSTFNL